MLGDIRLRKFYNFFRMKMSVDYVSTDADLYKICNNSDGWGILSVQNTKSAGSILQNSIGGRFHCMDVRTEALRTSCTCSVHPSWYLRAGTPRNVSVAAQSLQSAVSGLGSGETSPEPLWPDCR